MSFSRPIQWCHSHANPIWSDGTLEIRGQRRYFETVKEPRNRFQGIYGKVRQPYSKYSYSVPSPIDYSKILSLKSLLRGLHLCDSRRKDDLKNSSYFKYLFFTVFYIYYFLL